MSSARGACTLSSSTSPASRPTRAASSTAATSEPPGSRTPTATPWPSPSSCPRTCARLSGLHAPLRFDDCRASRAAQAPEDPTPAQLRIRPCLTAADGWPGRSQLGGLVAPAGIRSAAAACGCGSDPGRLRSHVRRRGDRATSHAPHGEWDPSTSTTSRTTTRTALATALQHGVQESACSGVQGASRTGELQVLHGGDRTRTCDLRIMMNGRKRSNPLVLGNRRVAWLELGHFCHHALHEGSHHKTTGDYAERQNGSGYS